MSVPFFGDGKCWKDRSNGKYLGYYLELITDSRNGSSSRTKIYRFTQGNALDLENLIEVSCQGIVNNAEDPTNQMNQRPTDINLAENPTIGGKHGKKRSTRKKSKRSKKRSTRK